jgi:MFS family permease
LGRNQTRIGTVAATDYERGARRLLLINHQSPITTDTFGERHATTNYGFLYMAQGIGSIVGAPLAAWLHEVTGNWIIVFAVMIVMDFLAAIMAIAVLKPLRRGYTYAPNALTENTPLPI